LITRPDCLHFRGHVPCDPHKKSGVHCEECPEFREREGRILLIKLGAAGDVIRTTPLLSPLREKFPNHAITWVTDFPELVPSKVDDVVKWNVDTVLWLEQTSFDLVINLDKDRQACALANAVQAKQRWGFVLGEDGICRPATDGVTEGMAQAAAAKFETGLFDDVSQACRKSYPQEIFEICGFAFSGQEYVLDRPKSVPDFGLPTGKAVLGLNTGCGGRWTSRLWPEEHWAELARSLQVAGYAVVLLGGPEEDEKNQRLAEATGACYPGHFPLATFIGLMDQCELIVSAVTMGMHIALGLGKKLVLFNNIFNPHEFELYGRGKIVGPTQTCECYFQPRCRAESFCLKTLTPVDVQAAVVELLASP
jgi:ADP-heptose:LPS heptosyltransferase